MKRIVVTGGSGFIGSSITHFLVESGHRVRVIDNNSRGRMSRLEDIKNDFEFLIGDIRDESFVHDSFKEMDAVVHLAYVNGTENFYSQPEKVLDVALKGMQNVITGIKANSISELYLASSSEVYQKPDIFPTPEFVRLVVPDVFNPRYSYGLGKIVQEFMAIHATPSLRKKVIIRPHNIYGPDMGSLHVVPELFAKIAYSKNGVVPLKGDGSQKRSFCEIQDFIQAFSLLFADETVPEIVNIGTNFEISILELALMISEKIGVERQFVPSTLPNGETDRRLPDIRKIMELGYNPVITISKGLDRYYSWFKNLESPRQGI